MCARDGKKDGGALLAEHVGRGIYIYIYRILIRAKVPG